MCICNPIVDKDISSFIADAEEIAIRNKLTIRPIAMIMVFRKIAHKIARAHNKPVSDIRFEEARQLGCEKSNGTDIVIHAIRISRYMNPTYDFAKSDCENAFQLVLRSEVIKCVKADAPTMLKMTKAELNNVSSGWFVGLPRSIQCGEGVIRCTAGS
jgi:hypothetical protein